MVLVGILVGFFFVGFIWVFFVGFDGFSRDFSRVFFVGFIQVFFVGFDGFSRDFSRF